MPHLQGVSGFKVLSKNRLGLQDLGNLGVVSIRVKTYLAGLKMLIWLLNLSL
jgi:hypothetical protein